MATITIPDEDLEFLLNLSHELNTQDNRATADPYYFTIMTSKPHYTLPDFGERVVFYDEDSGEEFPSIEEAKKYFINEGLPEADVKPRLKDLKEIGVIYEEKHQNVFLTEKACLAHLKREKHHYPDIYGKKATTYVEHAFRNPEMGRLIKFLKSLERICKPNPLKMKEFTSHDTVRIPGRDMIKLVTVPNPGKVMQPEGLPKVGEVVWIDNEIYEVLGVECAKVLMDPPYIEENVGLQVTKICNKEEEDTDGKDCT